LSALSALIHRFHSLDNINSPEVNIRLPRHRQWRPHRRERLPLPWPLVCGDHQGRVSRPRLTLGGL